ncbi:MAG TPA: YcxB family protein, partial [Alphaproteobacteria bacterium]|nr:YcxB family protein [Alphaproteobacteria bacterium]
MLEAAARSRDVWAHLALVLLGPALLLLAPWITRLVAAALYRGSALADREVSLHLTADGIEGGATDLYARIGWAAVTRLVETSRHLFILISRREALIIPRRAVPNEDHYSTIRGFIRARTGLGTHA